MPRRPLTLASAAPGTDYDSNDFISAPESDPTAVAGGGVAAAAGGGRHQPRTGMIRIENSSKTFTTADGVIAALENIDLAIKEGEFVSIVGPSGCGKSTLLMCVAGLIEASAGSVRSGTRRVSGPFTDVGIVFQEALLLDWRTVLGNVLFQIEMRGLDRQSLREPRRRAARPRRARRASSANIPGNCPAACVSASRSAAPSSTIRRCC